MSTDTLVPRARAPRTLAGLAAAALITTLLPIVAVLPETQATGTTPSAPTAPVVPRVPVVPAAPTFAAAIDGVADYQAQSVCSPVAKVGAVKLAALLTRTYGKISIGIPRACSQGGLSEHKEGRALDWMVSMRVPAQRAKAADFLNWLLARDQFGNAAAMAKRLGIMYIGWNNRFWRGYDTTRGWTELKGCLTDPAKKAKGYDTYCHRNHVHLSLTWEGATGLTSYWTGKPLPGSCASPWSSAPPAPVAALDLVPVTPVRVFDTRSGTAESPACRLGAPRWGGDRRDLVVPVVGQGEVPATGVAAVAVRLTVFRATAPLATVSVRTGAGGVAVPVVSPLSGITYASTAVVPVATDGTIRIAIDRGTADVLVDVLAWAPPAVPDVVPPVVVTPPVPAAAGTTGKTHVVEPVTVYDGKLTPLAPGEVRTLSLAGLGGIPAAGLTGLALGVVVGPTATVDYISVHPGTSAAAVASVRTSTRSIRSTQVMVPTKDGVVTIRNSGASPVAVQVRLHGWMTDLATDGGSALTLRASAVTVLDSARRVGLAGAVVSATPRSFTLPVAAVPAGSRAVLVSMSALGGKTEGSLALTSRGSVQAVDVTPGRWAHEVVLLPLLPSGAVSVSTTSIGTQVRMSVLGYVS